MICRQNIPAVLEENGIAKEEFIRWLEDGAFAEYVCRLAKYGAMTRCPEVWVSLKKLADSGDVRAIKLYLDLCDKAQAPEAAGTPYNAEVDAVRRELFGDGE